MAVAATSCPVLQLGPSVSGSVQEVASRPQGVHMAMTKPSLSSFRLHLFGRKERMEVAKPGLSIHICRAAGGNGNGSGCCGGGSEEGGKSAGGCSGHGSSSAKDMPPVETDGEVLGIGKEFEALVATKTMEEFESQYDSGKMEGNIPRNVMEDVTKIYPEANQSRQASEERFLDVDELLAEARALSTSEKDSLVFDADFEDMLV